MVKVRKQVAKRPSKKQVAVRQRLGEGIRLSVYGQGKTGKTRLACTFPKPLLLLGTEEGVRSVCTSWELLDDKRYELFLRGKSMSIHFLPVNSSSDLGTVPLMVEKDGYKTVVLDTAGGLQDILLKEILGLGEIPIQKTWGIAQRQDWGTCGIQTKQRLKEILGLSNMGVNTVVIAHERNFNDESESEVITPTVGSALTPSVASWLNGACDYICQTYIREITEEQTIKIGKKEKTFSKKTGGVEYCLRVGPHPVYLTGFRVPPGVKLPDSIVDPTYDKIATIIQGDQ